MINKLTFKRIGIVVLVSTVLVSACVTIKSIIQPEVAAPNSSFNVELTLGQDTFDSATDYTLGDQIDAGYIGILMPEGWAVDQDEFEFTKYSESGDFNYTGYVYEDAAHAAALEAKDPAPRGYKWWGGISDIIDMHEYTEMKMTIKILTDDSEGEFTMKYAIGDKNDTENMARYPWYQHAVSDLIPITITTESGVNTIKNESIKVFPTITQNTINVIAPAQSSVIKVLSVTGKLMNKLQSSGNDVIDLSTYPFGTYIISVVDNDFVKNIRLVRN